MAVVTFFVKEGNMHTYVKYCIKKNKVSFHKHNNCSLKILTKIILKINALDFDFSWTLSIWYIYEGISNILGDSKYSNVSIGPVQVRVLKE